MPFRSVIGSTLRRFSVSVFSKHTKKYFSSMTAEPSAKKTKIGMQTIGTHNGTFHCDEVLACSILKLLPEFENSPIIRSRDPAKLSECDIVVDVGGVYDPPSHRYDHHQRSFNESLSTVMPGKKWQTKLSSAGLVYAHFGKQALSILLGSKDEEMLEVLYDKIYENFMEAVDAIDNGINISADTQRYTITTDISSRVANFNPSWNEPEGKKEDFQYEMFMKAMDMVGAEFADKVKFFGKVWWPARLVVKEAMDNRFKVHESGEIMMFEHGSCPWKDHLLTLEEEAGEGEGVSIKYVLYADANNTWMVQCVPISRNSFENRLSLPSTWRGVRDNDLSELCGIPECVFVHASGFVGGNKTREGALRMATESLRMAKEGNPVAMDGL